MSEESGKKEGLIAEYGSELGEALYWSWHRNPMRGNILRKEIERLRAELSRRPEPVGGLSEDPTEELRMEYASRDFLVRQCRAYRALVRRLSTPPGLSEEENLKTLVRSLTDEMQSSRPPVPSEWREAVKNLAEGNGGPIESDDNRPYVMVKRGDFDALTALLTQAPAEAGPKCTASPCDIIRAVNAERDRTATILSEFLNADMARLIVDAIHGHIEVPAPARPAEMSAEVSDEVNVLIEAASAATRGMHCNHIKAHKAGSWCAVKIAVDSIRSKAAGK